MSVNSQKYWLVNSSVTHDIAKIDNYSVYRWLGNTYNYCCLILTWFWHKNWVWSVYWNLHWYMNRVRYLFLYWYCHWNSHIYVDHVVLNKRLLVILYWVMLVSEYGFITTNNEYSDDYKIHHGWEGGIEESVLRIKNLSWGSQIGITRLAERWQTLIEWDQFSILFSH